MLPRPRAVLFDLDGTLVDSAAAICDAFAFALSTRGHASVPTVSVRKLIGHPLPEMFQRLTGNPDPAEVAALCTDYRARFQTKVHEHLRLTQGTLECLDALDGMPLGIVTTKNRAPTEVVLDAVGLRDRFTTIVTAEDTARQKPHPDPLLYAARQLGIPPRHAVYVGDTVLDVEAARAAGMPAVAVLCGFGDAAAITAAEPAVVIPDLGHLIECIAMHRVG